MFWFSAHLKLYRTSAGKSTFRTQNDIEKANFRCTANKKVFFSQNIHKNVIIYLYKSRLTHNNKCSIDIRNNNKNHGFSWYIKMTWCQSRRNFVYYNVCSFLWHRVSFFLFSLIKIIITFKNAQKERKANVSATYGGPLQCHKFKDQFKISVKNYNIEDN